MARQGGEGKAGTLRLRSGQAAETSGQGNKAAGTRAVVRAVGVPWSIVGSKIMGPLCVGKTVVSELGSVISKWAGLGSDRSEGEIVVCTSIMGPLCAKWRQ